MALKQNKNKTAEEKAEETRWAEEQLGIELESFDPIVDSPLSPEKNEKQGE